MDKDTKRQETDRVLLRSKLSAISAGIITAILLIALMYVFVSDPDFVIMAILAVVMVISVFIMINSFVEMSRRQREIDKEDYDEIAKAHSSNSKSSYKNSPSAITRGVEVFSAVSSPPFMSFLPSDEASSIDTDSSMMELSISAGSGVF